MSGRTRWQRDGQTVVGHRKTDRRNPRREPCERRQELIFAGFAKPDAALVGMAFRLPKSLEPFVAPGPHGIAVEVLTGWYVRIVGASADHCCTFARAFLATLAKERAGFTVTASIICRAGEHANKSYSRYLTVTRDSIVVSAGLIEPKLFEAA